MGGEVKMRKDERVEKNKRKRNRKRTRIEQRVTRSKEKRTKEKRREENMAGEVIKRGDEIEEHII